MSISQQTKARLQGFLNKPLPRSSNGLEERFRHWADAANNPATYAVNPNDKYAVAAKKKAALQNLARLIEKHPEIAEKVEADLRREREQASQQEAA